jgi:hypothetical protein
MRKIIISILLFLILSMSVSASNVALNEVIFYNGTWMTGCTSVCYPINLNNIVDGDFNTHSAGR